MMDDDGLGDLAHSMATEGQLQPVLVRKTADRYELIVGHRRYKAARLLGWAHIEGVVLDKDPKQLRLTMLTENIQREDMNPLDEAVALRESIIENGLTRREAAHRLGKSLAWADPRLDMLEGDPTVAQAVALGQLALGAAHPLNSITDPGWRLYYLDHAIQGGASVEKIRAWAYDANQQIQLQKAQGLPAVAPSMLDPPPEPLYPCWCCQTARPISELRQMPVCHDCLTRIHQLQEATS